jgi:hypothetical protein
MAAFAQRTLALAALPLAGRAFLAVLRERSRRRCFPFGGDRASRRKQVVGVFWVPGGDQTIPGVGELHEEARDAPGAPPPRVPINLVEDDAVVYSFNDPQEIVRTPRPRTLL